VFDSTLKSTSALASLKTAPPSCVRAPSISVTSKLAIPLTSKSPVTLALPVILALETKVTFPDTSKLSTEVTPS
jgi:hypothetical protein